MSRTGPRRVRLRLGDDHKGRAIGRKPTDITDELIVSMQEAAAIMRGEVTPARLHFLAETRLKELTRSKP